MQSKTTKQIRSELKRLIQKKKSLCTTEAEKNNAVNEARREINLKYGSGWREWDGLSGTGINREPSVYDGHIHGEHWMD
jgi:hypothetical protein